MMSMIKRLLAVGLMRLHVHVSKRVDIPLVISDSLVQLLAGYALMLIAWCVPELYSNVQREMRRIRP